MPQQDSSFFPYSFSFAAASDFIQLLNFSFIFLNAMNPLFASTCRRAEKASGRVLEPNSLHRLVEFHCLKNLLPARSLFFINISPPATSLGRYPGQQP